MGSSSSSPKSTDLENGSKPAEPKSKPIVQARPEIMAFTKQVDLRVFSDTIFLEGEFELFASAIARSTTMKSLTLDTKMTSQEVQQLSLALAQNTSIKYCDLSETRLYFGDACNMILGVSQSKSIKNFFFGASNLTEGFSATLRPLYHLLANPTLETLMLRNTPIDDDCVKDIVQGLKQNTSLQELNLSMDSFTFDQDFVESVSQHKSLTKLNLSAIADNLTAGANSFAMLIRTATNLQNLNIGYHAFERECAVILNALLESPGSLKTLQFASSQCTDEDCPILCQILQTNTTLTDLDLSGNKIEEQGIHDIIKGLSQNKTLKRLKIDHNPKLSDRSLESLATFLPQTATLEELVLSNLGPFMSDIELPGLKMIVDALETNYSIQKMELVQHVFADTEPLVSRANQYCDRNKDLVKKRNSHLFFCYSSLSQIAALPVDILKMMRMFLCELSFTRLSKEELIMYDKQIDN